MGRLRQNDAERHEPDENGSSDRAYDPPARQFKLLHGLTGQRLHCLCGRAQFERGTGFHLEGIFLKEGWVATPLRSMIRHSLRFASSRDNALTALNWNDRLPTLVENSGGPGRVTQPSSRMVRLLPALWSALGTPLLVLPAAAQPKL